MIFFESSNDQSLEEFNKSQAAYSKNEIEFNFPAYRSEESETTYLVSQQLTSKFGPVGEVLIEADKALIVAELDDQFSVPFNAVLVLTLLFLVVVAIYELTNKGNMDRLRLLKITYVICYIALSVVISRTVYNVYEYGANATTRAMTDSMVQRLTSVKEVGIHLEDLAGIDRMLDKYKSGSPTIEAIALIKGETNLAHTDPSQVGKTYFIQEDCYEYVNDLGSEQGKNINFRVAVNIPTDVLLNTILSSTKAFLVLFIACALVALIFLNAGTSLIELMDKRAGSLRQAAGAKADSEEEDINFNIGLNLVQPAYFMVVFVNALFIPFLPKLISDIAATQWLKSRYFIVAFYFVLSVLCFGIDSCWAVR